MTQELKLLPCPFCGGPACRSNGGTGDKTRFGTGCARMYCPAALFSLAHKTQEDADKTWNHRVAAEIGGTAS